MQMVKVIYPHSVMIKDKMPMFSITGTERIQDGPVIFYVKDIVININGRDTILILLCIILFTARPKSLPWHYAVIRYDASNHHCYMDGIGCAVPMKDAILLRSFFDLLPTKPIINNVDF